MRNTTSTPGPSASVTREGSLPDYLQPGLRLVFVGFNPSLRSATVGHYYAGRGNLFWALLYASGLLPEPLTYAEDARVLAYGIGLTDLVKRPTRSSAELAPREAQSGVAEVGRKLLAAAPRVVCFNGKGVYAWYRPGPVTPGPQPELIGTSRVFVVPSTSARNGHWSRAAKMEYFQALRAYVERTP